MSPETGTTAACSKVRLAGLWASLSSWAAAYSAYEPRRDAVHLVAHREPGHGGPDGRDGAGDVEAGHPVLRPAEAEPEDAHQVGLAGHQVPGAAVEAGRADPQQHVVLAGSRVGR